MALKATVYVFTVSLADVDRGAYAELELRMARHPSESAEYLLSRLLAYCLEYEEGIVLTDGVSADDEPAVLVRDLTGQVTAWIEVGAPSAERLHRGSKRAKRTAVYTHRDPAQVLALYKGARIHRARRSRSTVSGAGIWRRSAKPYRVAPCSACLAVAGTCTSTSMARRIRRPSWRTASGDDRDPGEISNEMAARSARGGSALRTFRSGHRSLQEQSVHDFAHPHIE